MLSNDWSSLPILAHDAKRKGAGKAPAIANWGIRAQFEASVTTLKDLKRWERNEHRWPGTGVPCGDAVAIDCDFVSDPFLAARVRRLAIDTFGATPFERQGLSPKVALIYRAAEAMPSIHLKTADGCGDGIDILATGSQFVAYGIHPETGLPYRWIGAESPLTAPLSAAPEVSHEQVATFLTRLRDVVELSKTGGRRKKGRGGGGTILLGPDGMVKDGRELHLTRTVYRAALALMAEGAELTASSLAERAWIDFVQSATLDDGRWTDADALAKAKALVNRVRRGVVKIKPKETADAVAPTYPDRRASVEEAEAATKGIIDEFFARHVPAWVAQHRAWKEAEEAGEERPEAPRPTSWAARVETAIGKSAQAVAWATKMAKAGFTVVYAFPHHRLGAELAKRFAEHRVEVRVYHGYESSDPDLPGQAMCLDLPAIRDAREAGAASIKGAVCERRLGTGEIARCPFHDQCGMTRQRHAKPQIWLVPHTLLFTARPPYVPAPDALVIDEGFALPAIPDKPVRFSLDAMGGSDCIVFSPLGDASNDLEAARGRLLRALRDHAGDGPVRREILLRHGVTETLAAYAYGLEWLRNIDTEIAPGMHPDTRREHVRKVGRHNSEVRKWAGIWSELRDFLRDDAEASGRLTLRYDVEGEVWNLERSSLSTVQKSWLAPALLIDATLADLALLEPVLGHRVEERGDVAARWSPHGVVRQIVRAPVSAEKLGIIEDREPETERRVVGDLLRLIRLRAALVGRDRTVVVIGPMRLVEKLTAAELPANVETGHFGAIAGIDRWANAAGLICIGRLLPGPRRLEPLAGVVTGRVARMMPDGDEVGRGAWYEKVTGGIRLASGEAVGVTHWRHPDPVVEAIRWQICEAGLIQAIGRLRALRRTVEKPYFLDIISDVPLPISVDRVEVWESARVGAWANMAPAGVLLTSPGDVMAAFPDLAPTRKAARLLGDLTLALTSIGNLSIDVRANVTEAEYKRAGRFPPVRAIMLPNGPASLEGWLRQRLGPIEWVRQVRIRIPETIPSPKPAQSRLKIPSLLSTRADTHNANDAANSSNDGSITVKAFISKDGRMIIPKEFASLLQLRRGCTMTLIKIGDKLIMRPTVDLG